MELYQLVQFAAIAECGNMTRAAEKLHLSQPSLSASLGKLEDEFGIRFFDRQKKSLKLNKAGVLFYSHVCSILEDVEKLREAIAGLSPDEKEFKVGFCESVPMWYFLSRFSLLNPECEMHGELFEHDADEEGLLLNRTYDAVVSLTRSGSPAVTSSYLLTDMEVLTVPKDHPLAGMNEISLRTVDLPDVAIYRIDNSVFRKQEPFYKSLEPRVSVREYYDLPVFTQVVMNSNIPSLTTKLSSHYHYEAKDRKCIPITDVELHMPYYISYLRREKGRLAPLLDYFSKRTAELE